MAKDEEQKLMAQSKLKGEYEPTSMRERWKWSNFEHFSINDGII